MQTTLVVFALTALAGSALAVGLLYSQFQDRGACCRAGECVSLTSTQCATVQGSFSADLSCADVPCFPPTPAPTPAPTRSDTCNTSFISLELSPVEIDCTTYRWGVSAVDARADGCPTETVNFQVVLFCGTQACLRVLDAVEAVSINASVPGQFGQSSRRAVGLGAEISESGNFANVSTTINPSEPFDEVYVRIDYAFTTPGFNFAGRTTAYPPFPVVPCV
jgi:hypothetical protein